MDLPMQICTREIQINKFALDYLYQRFNSVLDGIQRHQSLKFEGEFKPMTEMALEKIEEQEKHHLWNLWWQNFVKEKHVKKKRSIDDSPSPKVARARNQANRTNTLAHTSRIRNVSESELLMMISPFCP
jgi:hypothetical protein